VTDAAVQLPDARPLVRRGGWQRPALIGLLAATALLYLVGLSASGWANGFYSAAVEAGTKSWKAFFFGSFDSSNFITVDKPPASLWVMELFARAFGVNAWSILVPQALEGVAAVGLLYATVRRRFGPGAGLLAGAVLALTPVATLMFRFNNPDALLTLLLVAAAYALTRALEHASGRWLVLCGVLIGLGFLTKMLQALLVVPGFAFVYLLAAPAGTGRRVRQLLLAGAASLLSAGWWVVAVELWPASSRPYIGGSQDNSLLNLIFGYNGFGRITGTETGSVVGGGGAGAAGAWGPTGLTRLFGAEMGAQISWLLPAALILGGATLWLLRRARRTDGRRAAVLLWGSWLVVTGLVFSLAQGIIHPYYTVALAPAIGALVGIGSVSVWRRRTDTVARAAGSVALGASAIWAYALLDRTPDWHPALRVGVLLLGLGAAVAFVLPPRRLTRRGSLAVAVAAIVAVLSAPAAYSLQTASVAHSGALPSAGPAGASAFGGPGGRLGGARSRLARPVGGANGSGQGFGPPGGGTGPQSLPPSRGGGARISPPTGGSPGGGSAGANGPGRGTGLGNLLRSATPSAALVRLLQANASSYRWAAAAIGANDAAGVELASGEPIMAIGGFNGTDPAPTLAQFEAYVAAGKIRYFLASSGSSPGGRSSSSSAIARWVEQTFRARTVGGVTVYDLASRTSS